MRIRVLYPSGKEFEVSGDWVGPAEFDGNQDIVVRRDDESVFLGDARGVYLDHDTEQVLYQPRGNWGAGLKSPWPEWLAEHPEWPPAQFRGPETHEAAIRSMGESGGSERPNPGDHPAVARYVDVLTPLIAADQAAALLSILNAFPAELARTAKWQFCDERRAAMVVGNVVSALIRADVVIWKDEMLEAASAGSESFHLTILREDQIPNQPQLWFFETECALNADLCRHLDLGGESRTLHSMLISKAVGVKDVKPEYYEQGWIPAEEFSGRVGYNVCYFVNPPGAVEGKDASGLPALRSLPTVWVGEALPVPYHEHVACSAFMNLPFVATDPAPLPRQYRRSRERKKETVPVVRTVALRRKAKAEDGDAASRSVEWSCRWIVRGHWRKQYIPGQEDRRPAFVQPHTKGPEGKPLRQPRESVFVVKR